MPPQVPPDAILPEPGLCPGPEAALAPRPAAGLLLWPVESHRKSTFHSLLVSGLLMLVFTAPLTVNMAAVSAQTTAPTEEHETNQSCETAQHSKLFESRRRPAFRPRSRTRQFAETVGLKKYDRPEGTIGHRLSNGLLAPLTC